MERYAQDPNPNIAAHGELGVGVPPYNNANREPIVTSAANNKNRKPGRIMRQIAGALIISSVTIGAYKTYELANEYRVIAALNQDNPDYAAGSPEKLGLEQSYADIMQPGELARLSPVIIPRAQTAKARIESGFNTSIPAQRAQKQLMQSTTISPNKSRYSSQDILNESSALIGAATTPELGDDAGMRYNLLMLAVDPRSQDSRYLTMKMEQGLTRYTEVNEAQSNYPRLQDFDFMGLAINDGYIIERKDTKTGELSVAAYEILETKNGFELPVLRRTFLPSDTIPQNGKVVSVEDELTRLFSYTP